MKKLLYFFWLLSLFLFAENHSSIEKFMILKSFDKTLTFSDLENKDDLFEDFRDNTQLQDKKANYWIKVEFVKTLVSSRYVSSYTGFEFDVSSFHHYQKNYKVTDGKIFRHSFFYTKGKSNRTYYFRVSKFFNNIEPTYSIQTYHKYSKDAFNKANGKSLYILFSFILGMLVMVIIYNLIIYIYYRKISFLYYSFMQLSFIFIVIYDLGILNLSLFTFYTLSLFSAIWAVLFMKSFFNTAKHLPRINKILVVYIAVIILDSLYLIIKGHSVISYYGLFSMFGIIAIVIGYLRLKQGFIPAKFFLWGWGILLFTVFYAEHIGNIAGISPLFFGTPIEVIFIAIALAYKLKLALDEKKEQQELLIHQSKLASMGEMIGNIAHQWKQPLTYLSYNFMNLREASKRNLLDDTYLCKKLDKADSQLNFMSETIDNFKNFYLPNKEKELFSLHQASLETLEIMSYQFKQQHIPIQIDMKEDTQLNSYKNEYKQVLLNLLTNAKDAFLERKVLKPKITISFSKNLVSVADNAGGIPSEVLKRIYEPYFTTKEGSSGIGLYMSKMIVEKDMNGQLSVENFEEGVLFKIIF